MGKNVLHIDNKESYISNYAVIDSGEDINAIIIEVEEFYNSRNIIPKIFYRHDSLELDKLRPYFVKYGYSIREFDLELMILDLNVIKNKIVDEFEINIKRHLLDGPEYYLAIEQDEGETYGVRLLNKQIESGNNMFFAYDELKNPVSMALAEKYNDVVYISNVYTTPSKRQKGYGTAVVNALISHYKNSLIYLHTNNPDAASVYRKLGFSSETLKSWWAIKGLLPEWCRE